MPKPIGFCNLCNAPTGPYGCKKCGGTEFRLTAETIRRAERDEAERKKLAAEKRADKKRMRQRELFG